MFTLNSKTFGDTYVLWKMVISFQPIHSFLYSFYNKGMDDRYFTKYINCSISSQYWEEGCLGWTKRLQGYVCLGSHGSMLIWVIEEGIIWSAEVRSSLSLVIGGNLRIWVFVRSFDYMWNFLFWQSPQGRSERLWLFVYVFGSALKSLLCDPCKIGSGDPAWLIASSVLGPKPYSVKLQRVGPGVSDLSLPISPKHIYMFNVLSILTGPLRESRNVWPFLRSLPHAISMSSLPKKVDPGMCCCRTRNVVLHH